MQLVFNLEVMNVPSNLPHKSRAQEIEEIPKYMSVSALGAAGLEAVNVGSATPSPDNAGSPWLKLDAAGAPIGWYVNVNGVWTKVPVAP